MASEDILGSERNVPQLDRSVYKYFISAFNHLQVYFILQIYLEATNILEEMFEYL